MSRPVDLTATLTTRGPLAIGNGAEDAESDRPLVRDQEGRPIIPGTSLAGALRAAAARRYGDGVARELFGAIAEGDLIRSERSPVTVEDATYTGEGVPPVQTRQHVAIDRERLSAADHLKFDRQTWPLDLPFHLRLRCPERLLGELRGVLDEFASPRGGLGAGACRVELTALTATTAPEGDALVATATDRWNSPELPRPRGAPLDLPMAATSNSAQRTAFVLELTFETVEPLACRKPRDAFTSDYDNDPFTVLCHEDGSVRRHPAIPGTSLLGVLRQRAERSLCRAGVALAGFHDHATEDDDPLLRSFGRIADTGEGGHAGAFVVEDFVCRSNGWGPGDDPRDDGSVAVRTRVKLDRLTHSTLGGAFFDDTVIQNGVRFTGRITVAPPHRSADDGDLALLAVGLRDIASGAAGLGGSTRSGYGTVRIVDATIREYPTGTADHGAAGEPLISGDGELRWPEQYRTRLEDAWKDMIDA